MNESGKLASEPTNVVLGPRAPKSSDHVRPPQEIPMFKENGEILSPSEDLVLLPADLQATEKIVDTDSLDTPPYHFMDFPEIRESPGNTAILSTSGDYSLVKVIQRGKTSYHIIKGPYGKNDAFKPISHNQPPLYIDLHDQLFFTRIDRQTTLSWFDEFQGPKFVQGIQARPMERTCRLAAAGICRLDIQPYCGDQIFTHMYTLYEKLPSEILRNIRGINGYDINFAVGMSVGLNQFNQIVIQAAGLLSQERDEDNTQIRGKIPSAFVLVLNRNIDTELLAGYLLSPGINERDKREVLGKVFETVDTTFPGIKPNYFLDDLGKEVKLSILDRTQLPRAFFTAAQVITSDNISEEISFTTHNIKEAFLSAGEFLNKGILGKINIIFKGQAGTINFSRLDSSIIQTIVNFYNVSISEKGSDSFIYIKNIDENVIALLTSLRPFYNEKGNPKFDEELLVTASSPYDICESYFEVDFETDIPPNISFELQAKNIGFDINKITSLPNIPLYPGQTLVFKSTGNLSFNKVKPFMDTLVSIGFKGRIFISDEKIVQKLQKRYSQLHFI
jgi:hypothetical protein